MLRISEIQTIAVSPGDSKSRLAPRACVGISQNPQRNLLARSARPHGWHVAVSNEAPDKAASLGQPGTLLRPGINLVPAQKDHSSQQDSNQKQIQNRQSVQVHGNPLPKSSNFDAFGIISYIKNLSIRAKAPTTAGTQS